MDTCTGTDIGFYFILLLGKQLGHNVSEYGTKYFKALVLKIDIKLF